MDKIALISDIHGNLPALETVLSDVESRGIKSIYCLGDMVGKGPDSDKVLDLCKNVCEKTVLGNWDDFMVKDSQFEATRWHQQKLGSERIDYIRTLPNTIDFVMSGKNIRLFHASHIGVHHRVRLTDSKEIHMGMFSNTKFTGNDISPNIVGYGDVHEPYQIFYDEKCLFNVGSVGNPLGFTEASYCILEGELGGTDISTLTMSFVRLPYDIETAIKIAEVQDMPDLIPFSRELRTGEYRGNFKVYS